MDFSGGGREGPGPLWQEQNGLEPGFSGGRAGVRSGSLDSPIGEWMYYLNPTSAAGAHALAKDLGIEDLAPIPGGAGPSSGQRSEFGSGEGDEDSYKGRAERARERNRRAVRKFRERQKVKALEKEALLQDVTSRMEALLKEKEELQIRNQDLESRCVVMGLRNPPPYDTELSEVPIDFIPFNGWRDFERNAPIILHVVEPPLRLTCSSISNMGIADLFPIWKMYINGMAAMLPHVHANFESPAGKRLAGLKNEVTALCGYFGLYNPALLHHLQGCRLMDEPASPHLVPEQTPQEWAAIAEILQLSEAQQEMLLKARDLHDTAMRLLRTQQQEVEVILKDLSEDEKPFRAGRPFMRLLAAVETLNKNLEQAHRITVIFGSQTWGVVLDPVQFATFMVTAFPWTGDMWKLIDWVEGVNPKRALQGKEGGASAQAEQSSVSQMMSDNFRMLWSWYNSRQTAAITGEALRKVPAALRLL